MTHYVSHHDAVTLLVIGIKHNVVLLQAVYDVIVSPSPGSAAQHCSWQILKEPA